MLNEAKTSRPRPRPKIIMKYQIMINNIWFKIIAGKISKIPEFYTIFARKMSDYIIRQRDRGQAEAKTSRPRPRPRPRPKFWLRGHFGLEDLTSLFRLNARRLSQNLTVTVVDGTIMSQTDLSVVKIYIYIYHANTERTVVNVDCSLHCWSQAYNKKYFRLWPI